MEFDFSEVLLEVVGRRASDLHLTAGAPPMVRIRGRLTPMDGYPSLTPTDTREVIYSILSNAQRQKLENNWQLDFAYQIPGAARFRVNAYFQRSALGAAFRLIPFDVVPLETLGLPPIVAEFANKPRGLVLVTGPTGSGKSTTLASLVDVINETREEHIMTIEDPIEFLHQHKKCIVNQRELGSDATSFGDALKAALRQDPDVILVGEMRDLETIGTAITAAETGHLVFATLHTQDNTLRWLGVTLTPANGSASVRITGVRADASLLGAQANLQASAITGFVSFNGQTPVPVTQAQQPMANAALSLNFIKQQASPPTGGAQTTIPLVYQEASPAAFHAASGSTAPTRLRMVLSNVPGTVQVYAPVFPMEGPTHAQLFSADATGFGGTPVTGAMMAGVAYQQLTVTGGVATAAWVVLSADPAVAESFTFPLLVTNAAASDLNAIQVAASLAPVSAVSVASASVGVPYSVSLANPLTGGGPFTWSVTSGALPNGLTLNPGTGAVSGTPTSPGTFAFTVYVSNNSVFFPQNASPSFTITVAPLPRYRDFSVPQNLVNLRITTTTQGTGSCSLTGRLAETSLTARAASATAAAPRAVVVNSNVTFTNQLVNDTSDPAQAATNVIIRDNLPSGLSMMSCSATGGASCSSSGNQVTVNYGTLAPGQCVTATVVAQVGLVPNGTVLENPVSAAADQVNADLSASTASSSIIVTAPVGPPASITPSGGTPQSTALGTAFPTALQATVSDSTGNPVSGVTVTFIGPPSGAFAVLSSPTAVTNASGVASVMAMANNTAGSYIVTASVAGLPAPAIFSLTNTNNPTCVGCVNLALNKSATQSSTLAGYPSAAASSAIDGNTDGLFFDNSVTATFADVNAWWQVDLGSPATINSVAIWNRTDCCASRLNDYWVFVSNTPFAPTDTPATLQSRAGTFSSHQTTAPNPSNTILLPAGTQGRYVRVQLTGTNNLSLAEVQVFGPLNTTLMDLAQGQPATQSSTLAGTPGPGVAVDGNPDGVFTDGSVTATNADTNAWWQVDLGASETIASVVVWNRTDCCSSRLGDYWVFVSDTPFNATDTPASLQNRTGTFASHQTTAPSPSTTITVGGPGRYVRVQLTGANYLSLAEVQVWGPTPATPPPANLAPGKPATQSSTLPGTPSAGAAVDGMTDGVFTDGSVTATNLDTNAWWQMDLGASTTVNSVVVWNRTDCCVSRLNDYWVFVSNTPFLPTDTPATLQNRAGTFSSHQTTAPSPSTTIMVGAPGRYIRVQLTGANYLSLAEVQVFGPPLAASDVAAGQAATQSSTLPGTPPASVAVDGNTDGAFADHSVTATNLDTNAWWQVDLGGSFSVSSVVVWNRTDCCGSRLNDYWVFVSNTPFLATDTPTTLQNRAGTFASHQTVTPNPSTSVSVSAPGRYVRVQLTGANYLSLAEVQVIGQ